MDVKEKKAPMLSAVAPASSFAAAAASPQSAVAPASSFAAAAASPQSAAGASASAAPGSGRPEDLSSLNNFPQSYEDYLDSHVTEVDLKFLQDEDVARQLVELNFIGSQEAVRREEFEARKRELEQRQQAAQKLPKVLSNAGRKFPGKPFLAALAQREEDVRNGKLTTIVFIRDFNKHGQEISGYIDYAHRLKTEDFTPYFDGTKRLLPKPSDLSYYNWHTQVSTSNPTPNFEVKADDERGLMFKNKRDRKKIIVDPDARSPGDNSERIVLQTSEYVQTVMYDHHTRRRS